MQIKPQRCGRVGEREAGAWHEFSDPFSACPRFKLKFNRNFIFDMKGRNKIEIKLHENSTTKLCSSLLKLHKGNFAIDLCALNSVRDNDT